MPTVLITGANRGIGLEFARQYASDGWDVIATARRSSPELDALQIPVEALDLSDPDAVAAFTVDKPLDLFIANAGTNHPMNTDGAGNARDLAAVIVAVQDRLAADPADHRLEGIGIGEMLPARLVGERRMMDQHDPAQPLAACVGQ